MKGRASPPILFNTLFENKPSEFLIKLHYAACHGYRRCCGIGWTICCKGVFRLKFKDFFYID